MAITTSASTGASRGRRSVLEVLRWGEVLEHYKYRVRIHRRLLKLHANQEIVPFARLLVGVSDRHGNYSANEHGLGPQILSENPNAAQRLLDVAGRLLAVQSGQEVPSVIHSAALKYFRIGVGSEASCMLNPNVCWVANTRTIWAALVFKHGGSLARADEELQLYRDEDETSEMAYRKWVAIHRELRGRLTIIADEGSGLSRKAAVPPGKIKYIWADAIASALYAYHHDAD